MKSTSLSEKKSSKEEEGTTGAASAPGADGAPGAAVAMKAGNHELDLQTLIDNGRLKPRSEFRRNIWDKNWASAAIRELIQDDTLTLEKGINLFDDERENLESRVIRALIKNGTLTLEKAINLFDNERKDLESKQKLKEQPELEKDNDSGNLSDKDDSNISDDGNISIEGLNKAVLLLHLYNNAKFAGQEMMELRLMAAVSGDGTIEAAVEAIDDAGKHDPGQHLRFDYIDLGGGKRPLKVNLGGSIFWPDEYDGNHGQGKAKEVVGRAREEHENCLKNPEACFSSR